MSDITFVQKPCKHCPFRNDITPFLRAERAADLAYSAQNPYSSFPCHKTTVSDDESEEGEMMCNENTKECAGFLTLRAQELGEEGTYECVEDGFKPSYDIVYESIDDMIYAYEEEAV